MNNNDQCMSFAVTKRWAVANVFNQIAVKISNDTSDFTSYLKKTKIACHFDGLELKGSVVNDERIVCEQLRIASSNFPRNAKVVLHDFYVTFDKRRLRFDDDADYYFNIYARDCGSVHAAGNDCVTCLWNDADERHYLSKCSARNPCKGPHEVYDTRDADSGARTSSAVEQDVRVKCKNATIRSFEPQYGLRTGGTAMKIVVRGHGILAENATAVVVSVAGRDCTGTGTTLPVDDGSVETTITCVTTTAAATAVVNGTGGDTGSVRITYVQQSSRRLTVESAETFDFVEPRVTAASPTCGPVGGGTLLNLTGEYLNASAVRVRVTPRDTTSANDAAATTCELIAVDRNRILCVTGASRGGPVIGTIELLFENGYRVQNETFVYAGDPALDPSQTFDGVASGGTTVPVRGNHFSCIKSAAFCVDTDGARHCADRRCLVHNDTYMVCVSPQLRPVAAVQSLRFGLRMDFADHQLDLYPQPDRPTYDVYPDPVYDDFVMSDDRRYVAINGHGSDWNCPTDDVTVRIVRPQKQYLQEDAPAADCAVVRSDHNLIICEIDAATWPDVAANRNGEEVVLRVFVGHALAYLVREKSTANPALVAYGTVIVTGLLVFFAIVIVVAVFRYKKKNQNDGASQLHNVHGAAAVSFPGTIAELQLLQTGKSVEMVPKS